VTYGYCFAGLAKAEQLDVAGANEWYRRAFQLVQDAGNTQSQHARLTRALLAEGLYLQDRVAEAEELLNETFDAAAVGGGADFMIRHYCLRARILALHGNHAGAASHLDDGVRTAAAFSLPRLRAAVDLERVRLGFAPRPGFVPATRGAHPPPADGLARITAELEDETAITLLLGSGDREQIRVACDWANEWVRTLEGTGRELARLRAARLSVSCLWAAGRGDDAERAVLPVAVECARHEWIRFLLDGGPLVVAALTSLREHAASAQDEDGLTDLPHAFVDAVLSATH
jgi:serine/threonine-protein kinase PknK